MIIKFDEFENILSKYFDSIYPNKPHNRFEFGEGYVCDGCTCSNCMFNNMCSNNEVDYNDWESFFESEYAYDVLMDWYKDILSNMKSRIVRRVDYDNNRVL